MFAVTSELSQKIEAAAPALAAALETATKSRALERITSALGLASDADETKIGAALAAPDAPDKLKSADKDFLQGLLGDAIDAVAANQEQILKDVKDAREKRDATTGFLAFTILIAFAVVASVALLAAASTAWLAPNAQISPVVVGLVGTVLGYIAGYAQQVVSFYFGSSMGSTQKSDLIGSTLRQLEKKP